MKIKEFFKKLFGCKEKTQSIHESSAVIEPIVKTEFSVQDCGVTTAVSSVEAPVEKPKKRKRGRPRKKKKSE